MRARATPPQRPGRYRRLTAAGAALGLLVALGAAQTTGSTEAAWNDSEHAGSTITAGTLGAPRVNGCGTTGRTFTPRWLAPSAPSLAPTSYQYRLYWTPLLGTEAPVFGWTTATGTQFAYTIPTTILTAGTYRFQVRAVRSTWVSAPRTGTASVLSALGVISLGGCSWSP
ncbi:SipW-dependent-type signal peptide-containing protein [Pseudactinotalea sp.]|uniref:SipW-dependent-type signal peptide-containing protein n=1 Tax=Pseudactinotalea sp. TaxID=1926260 RepID=UPI003B3AF1F6